MQTRGHLCLPRIWHREEPLPITSLILTGVHQGSEVVSPTPAKTSAHRGYVICHSHPGGKQQSCIQTQDFQLQSQALNP